MQEIADRLHRAVLGVSLALFGVMFAAQMVIVLLRYIMGVGFLELQDLVTYSFSALVVLTIPLALRLNRHVRVDILRAGLGARANARIDRAGHILFTLPVFGLLTWNALPLVRESWAIFEGSRETGGLGGLFIVKTTVIVMSLLVLFIALVDLVSGARDDD
ncbi:MAG TPA: TRAP transporter small permease subunit [Rhodobacterales bacterium]|nr:TRAP transporter small permease subunit [Rhodobacterales bacterium]